MYKQTDYPEIMLGSSGLPVSKYGCLAILLVNFLNDAGYQISVEDFFHTANTGGLFTDQGLLIWEMISQLFPQVHLDQGDDYKFIRGMWGTHPHFVGEHDGVTEDPYYGVNSVPAGFIESEVAHTAMIDPFQVPAPVEPAPTDPTPTAPSITRYTVQSGDTLGGIISSQYGSEIQLWGDGGLVEKIAHYNGITDANVINVGETIILPPLDQL